MVTGLADRTAPVIDSINAGHCANAGKAGGHREHCLLHGKPKSVDAQFADLDDAIYWALVAQDTVKVAQPLTLVYKRRAKTLGSSSRTSSVLGWLCLNLPFDRYAALTVKPTKPTKPRTASYEREWPGRTDRF
jgi:hypothetical protein